LHDPPPICDRLEPPDGLVELLAVLGVLDRDLLHLLRRADGPGGQQDQRVVPRHLPRGPPARPAAGPAAPPRPPPPPPPPPASRPAPRTATPSRSTRYWLSDATERCWVSVTPGASGATRNSSTSPGASPVRAGTSSR